MDFRPLDPAHSAFPEGDIVFSLRFSLDLAVGNDPNRGTMAGRWLTGQWLAPAGGVALSPLGEVIQARPFIDIFR